ncbi:Copper resistance protein D [compost metagenome]|uniref:Copper resistance D family protein n=1 Tax=Pseudomonas wadenswilerensis TaxID=1785161 RepID=A0A380SW37_9PSED|nr:MULTISPECIES: CopD family protein [Pseudomonas]MCE5982297.1 CopD family protein [Pseudomonas sp. LF19]UVM20805.1 CopD family protein [Pseudomonas wadenswilerensis]SPO65516.1 Membrane protein [Pseudomonas sp. JV241A]SUQ61953.1 Copper resistance D family protein [Pseudomonas wadenswilerensis]
MPVFALSYSLHVLAALVWVGGMFFAWLVLRPAAVAALDGPARLRLWVEVFQRFFVWVWMAIALLAISGMLMINTRFASFETTPRHVQVMIGGGIAMFALFFRIQSLLYPELRKAVQAEDWPAGAAAMAKIRRMVGINLMLGIAVVLSGGVLW